MVLEEGSSGAEHVCDALRPCWPERLSAEQFYPLAYRYMYFARHLDARLLELFKKGYCKGTVTQGDGNEATAVGMSLPLRAGRDVVSLLHRDIGAHLVLGASPGELVLQYMAAADSPTQGREGNCHHGTVPGRRLPMMSHLGSMLSVVVGTTWAAREHGEEVFGLAVVGDGGSSTGDFHESLNIASVRRVPVVFLVQNNHFSFSTPTSAQYRCRRLSDRAAGYGIPGRTIDGTDVLAVYEAVSDALDAMRAEPGPVILECMTVRLRGHAAYDKGDYVTPDEMSEFRRHDPLPLVRQKLRDVLGYGEPRIQAIEQAVSEEVDEAVRRGLGGRRPNPVTHAWDAYARRPLERVAPYTAAGVKNGDAVRRALDYLLEQNPRAFLLGLDIGRYGSAFKTCKGLIDRYGPRRVIDMPIAESGTVGFALGASQAGGEPIVEFQFADFSTEATTQLGLNAGTWFFRAGQPAPLLFRLPCGGGMTMGAFHSADMEGVWARFCGLKLLYPATAQETFEALVAGFYDPNPCLVFEHKLLYWSKSGDIAFDGDLDAVWRPRRYREGSEVTVVALGAMVYEALEAAARSGRGVEVWNPFVLQPLSLEPIVESVRKTGRLLVVQESGENQGSGDRILARIAREEGVPWKCPPRLVCAADVPVPFAPELEAHFRPGAPRILTCIEEMLGER
jgi:2-oxoisovalerate dehydrogenase E1 component